MKNINVSTNYRSTASRAARITRRTGARVSSPSSGVHPGARALNLELPTSFGSAGPSFPSESSTHIPKRHALIKPVLAVLVSLFIFNLFSHSAYAAFSASISRSGTVNLAEAGSSTIRPTSSGTLGTGSDKVSITTNCTYSGYKVYVSATSSGGTNLNRSGASASDLTNASNYITTSTTATGSEKALSKDTWGVGKTASTFSGLPAYTSDAGSLTAFYNGTTSSSYDFYYGVNVSTAKNPGTYNGEVLYTVLMDEACLKYTLNFNGNSATTNNLTTQSITFDNKINLADISATSKIARTGYTLSGWKDQSGNSYGITGTADVNPKDLASVALTAQWTANSYTVAYAAGSTSGTCSVTSTSATYDSNVTLSSTKCTKTGYTQDGWSTSSSASNTKTYNLGATLTKPNFTSTANGTYTLYPHFSINTHTVTVSGGIIGTSGSTTTGTYNYGASITIKANSPSTGYHFTSWSSNNGGSFASSTSSQTTFTVPDANVTLTAGTAANTYTFSYNANGATGSPATSSNTGTYGGNITTSSTGTMAKTGYHLLGWSTNSSATSATCAANTSCSVSTLASNAGKTGPSDSGSTITLYAVWEANTYTITYNANGGSGTTNSQSVTYDGGDVILQANNFTYSGYDFQGWSRNPGASNAIHYNADTSYSINTLASDAGVANTNGGTIALYAVWKASVPECSSSVHPTATTGCKMKDGRVWVLGNSGNLTYWTNICTNAQNADDPTDSKTTYASCGSCPSGYTFPRITDFDKLVQAYGGTSDYDLRSGYREYQATGGALYTVLGVSGNRHYLSSTERNKYYAYSLSLESGNRSRTSDAAYHSKQHYVLCYKSS